MKDHPADIGIMTEAQALENYNAAISWARTHRKRPHERMRWEEVARLSLDRYFRQIDVRLTNHCMAHRTHLLVRNDLDHSAAGKVRAK